jgi:hypothetical protein
MCTKAILKETASCEWVRSFAYGKPVLKVFAELKK